MLTLLKEEFRRRLRFILSALHSIGLTPNQVTAFSFLLAIVSSILYYIGGKEAGFIPLGGLFLLFSGLCDALDGALAEKYGQTTVFGGILDSTLDRLGETIVISSIMLTGLCNLEIGLLALVSSFCVSYIRSRAEMDGISMSNIGIAERAERTIVLVIAGFFRVLDIGMMILAIISTVIVIQRLVHAARVSSVLSPDGLRKP